MASAHPLASLAGARVLMDGGNAADAAVATNAVLGVVQPQACGLGGDLFYLYYNAGDGRVVCINGSGRAARAAEPDFYHSRGLESIPERGPLSAITVPGCVDAWSELLSKFGTLSFKELLRPAVDYAEEGFPMSHLLSSVIKEVEPVLNRSKEWSDIFLPRGRPLEPGELLVQRDLAQTLKIIQKQGRDGFYKGQVGHEIVQHLQKNGGLLAEEDFEEHTSTWVKPAKAEYHECTVHVNPPNSQAIIILLWLNMLDELQDISSYECFATDYIHLMVEAGKLAYRERDGYISDPDMSDIPTDRLLSKNYAQGLVKKVDKDRAMTRSSNPYKIDCDKGDTTYFAVVDKERNCVSCIQSLYFDFGSGVVGGRSGVILQNRGAYFSLDTGHHNCLSPRKRTFHTLCASLTLKDDHPYIVFGSMGGDVQPQIHVQVLTKLLDFNMDIQEAIEAPRWAMLGTIYQPDENLYLEKRFPNGVVDGLKEKGHGIIMMPELWDVTGHAQGVVIDPKGALKAGADPRGDGAAIGY